MIDDVVLHQNVVRVVYVDGSVEGSVNAAASDVRLIHVTVQVKVYGVSAQPKRLSCRNNEKVNQSVKCCTNIRKKVQG